MLLEQVHTADAAVWGSCAGTELYRSYSSICNHGPEACKLDRNCHYINEYEIEVRTALPRSLHDILSQKKQKHM